MLDFMESVQNAFYEASHWNLDNSYGALNATARGTSLLPCSVLFYSMRSFHPKSLLTSLSP